MTPETKHPRGIYTLFFTEMWERVSYYGMRTLLTLFMLDQARGGMGLDGKTAGAIYGLYTAVVYLAALPGGWVGDRLLGTKRAVWWGGLTIAAGHLVLGFHSTEAFFVGLLLVALGSGLLKSNMSVLVGQLYPEGGARRDAGFTLFYMGVNLGAFIGPLVCAALGEKIGWRWGFSAAAAGMLLGLVQFKLTDKHLAGVGERIAHAGQDLAREWRLFWAALGLLAVFTTCCVAGIVKIDPVWLAQGTKWAIASVAGLFFLWVFTLAGLTREEKGRMVLIAMLFATSALFWAGFEQMGSSFNVFAEQHTIRQIGSFEVPAGWFQSVNPLFIIAFAPLVALLWTSLARRGCAPSLTTKVAWSLLLMAAGFLVAVFAARRALAVQQVWATWLLGIYFLHTMGELFLSPVGLSAVTKLSPPRLTGQMMGIWFLGSSLGNLVAGQLAGEVMGEAMEAMPGAFMQLVWIAGGAGVLLLLLARPLSALMKGVH
ncbi:MAG: peptide MFS transporter [Verrucomicrobiaceae bacterium]|jgi:POT family proton-dependent oligopeptide transporter|nr:peptide MFS transporter [Verrucomicrobiaceae bacterium]